MTGITSFHVADRSPTELRRNGSASTGFEGNPSTSTCGGGEWLLRDGAPVGHVTSAVHSPTLGRTVGLAFVSGAGLEKVEVQVAGERYPAQISRKAPYDPTSARVKA